MKQWLCMHLMSAVLAAFLAVPISSDAGDVSVADAALADFGVCYATLGNGGPNAGALIIVDVTTGADTLVGPTGIKGEFDDPGVPALAVKSTGEIFAMDIGTSSNLYIIDASTGAATPVGPTGLSSPPAIAFDGNDVLHAIDSNGDLYTIDHTTATATFVAATHAYIKGMAFDPVTAILWGCDASGDVYTIDQRTGATTLVGNTGQDPSPDLCFTDADELIASSGGGLSDNNLISIDKVTGAGTVIGPITFRSVSGMGMRHNRLSPATLQAHNARWVDRQVVITWRLIDVEGGLSFDITRASGSDVDFEMLYDARVDRRGNDFVFVDRSTEPGTTYRYRITIRENGIPMTSFETTVATPAGRFALDQNHPNPFNPTTTISFLIEHDQHVLLRVFDVSGRLVATIVDRPMRAGEHKEQWDGRGNAGNPATTGVYFFNLTVGNKTLTRKSVMVK